MEVTSSELERRAGATEEDFLEMEDEGVTSEEQAEPGELAPEDFYFDGPYLVFTAAYHLKRGYCCNSDCRHCPYK